MHPRINKTNLAMFYEFDGNLNNYNRQNDATIVGGGSAKFASTHPYGVSPIGTQQLYPPHGTYFLSGLDKYQVYIPMHETMSNVSEYSISMSVFVGTNIATAQDLFTMQYGYPSSNPNTYFHGFSLRPNGSAGIPQIWWLDITNNGPFRILQVSDPNVAATDNKNNMWFNIAVKVNGSTRTSYFNGRQIATDNYGHAIESITPNQSSIGGNSQMGNVFIKDFKVYKGDLQSSLETLGDWRVIVDVPDWTKYTVQVYDENFNQILNPSNLSVNPAGNRWRIHIFNLPGYVRDSARTLIVKKNGWIVAKKSIQGLYNLDFYIAK